MLIFHSFLYVYLPEAISMGHLSLRSRPKWQRHQRRSPGSIFQQGAGPGPAEEFKHHRDIGDINQSQSTPLYISVILSNIE